MRAWVKLYRPRRGSHFEAHCGGEAKCVFSRLLALVDEDGVGHLAGDDPHDGLARLLEWPPGPPRRRLRRLVDELVAEGCIVLEPGRVRLPNFGPKQTQWSDKGQTKVDQRSVKGPSKVEQSPGITLRDHSVGFIDQTRPEKTRREESTYQIPLGRSACLEELTDAARQRGVSEEYIDKAHGFAARAGGGVRARRYLQRCIDNADTKVEAARMRACETAEVAAAAEGVDLEQLERMLREMA